MAKKLFCIDGEITGQVALTIDSEHYEGHFASLLQKLGKGHFVGIIHGQSALYMGYVREGLWEGVQPLPDTDDDYVQARFFSEKEEWLCKLVAPGQWGIRHIREGAGTTYGYLDSVSPFIGKVECSDNGIPNFVHIVESGRKVDRYIPSDKEAKQYGLRLRSYIVKNECTGQAGFGMYRYVAIEGLDGERGIQ